MLELMQKGTQSFYATCAKEEFNKVTKKHTFRSFVNQDRSPETGSNILAKVKRKQNAVSSQKNSASLKFSLQEYEPGLAAEKQNTIKLRKKMQERNDIVTGVVHSDTKAQKFIIEAPSKTNQTYYDMLITQKKPFNMRKGSLVTPDRV